MCLVIAQFTTTYSNISLHHTSHSLTKHSVDTTGHVWLDLVDSQHPDFTTVAQLNAATAAEGEGELYIGVCVCFVVYCVIIMCYSVNYRPALCIDTVLVV